MNSNKTNDGVHNEKQKLLNKFYSQCPICGTIYYKKGHEARHKKSLKHQLANYVNNEMFDIKPCKINQNENLNYKLK